PPFPQKPPGLSPCPPGLTRTPAEIAPTPLRLHHLGIRLTGRLHLTLDLLPLAMQHALHLTLRMKHVETHRERWAHVSAWLLSLAWPRFIGHPPPPLDPFPAVGDDVLQAGPLRHHLLPTLPGAIRTSLRRHPNHTGGAHSPKKR